MNKLVNHQPAAAEKARFIFEKGKRVHQKIDRIVHGILLQSHPSIREMTISQLEAIRTVHRVGTLTISELSRSLQVSAPSVSTMVERLVEKGFLVRTRNQKDRRKVIICVSQETEQQIQQVEQTILGMFTDLIEKVGPEIGQMWQTVLTELERALEEHIDSHPYRTMEP